MNKTVLIIGAGASADFGYPLWGALKQQLSNLNVDDFLNRIDGLSSDDIDTHKVAFEEYLALSQTHSRYTLDRIIYEIDRPKEKHLKPTGHLVINIVGYLLAQQEQKDIEGLWVSELQNILVDFVARESGRMQNDHAIDFLENLTVISLNYDRVFEHFIAENFYEKLVAHETYQPKDLPQSVQLSQKTELKIYRPHGHICALPNEHHHRRVGMNENLGISRGGESGIRHPGTDFAFSYGDPNLLQKENFLRMGRYMYVVNERGETDYAGANGALGSAEAIFCLGLSSDGICQSSLNFRTGQKVYLSNEAKDVSAIAKSKPGPDYETLSKEDSRLDTNDFPAKFQEIVLN